MKPLILAADPGLKGSTVLLDIATRKLIYFADSHSIKHGSKNHLDAPRLADELILYSREIRFAVIEDVGGGIYTDKSGQRRGQGSAASFSFGRSAGIIDGLMAAWGIRIIKVRPATWKSLMNLSSNKSDSLTLARKLFPDNQNLFTRKKDADKAEASLLAWFGADRLL